MSHQHLLDNWTLQSAGELICNGLNGETCHELRFSTDGTDFAYTEAPYDVARFEALCQVLHQVVFADVLFVDDGYVDSWTEFAPLLKLREQQILITKPFSALEEHWAPRREAMVEELCFCPAVRNRHQENVAGYAATGESPDQFLAQLVWGGAGMLARAEYFRLFYVPHPSRERLFAHARFLRGPEPAQVQLQSFVQSQRLRIHEQADGSGFFARLNLPAVAVEIINEAADLSDLLQVALQMRSQYKRLRTWLAEFQRALDAEDIPEVLSRKKLLQSVSRNVDSLIALSPAGDTTVQVGVSLLKVGMKVGAPLNSLLNRGGIRAQINRLVIAPPGRGSIRKLLKLLGEEHTQRGINLEREFLLRSVRAGA